MLDHLPTTDSTMVLARARAESGAPHGHAVVADAQTGGRGRRGRTWESPPGVNLYVTMVLRPDGLARAAPLLTLRAAAALAEALDVQVKWPNDLVTADGRKLGGLLAEMETQGEHVRYVLLGLGLNVNQIEFPGLPNATSLAMLRGPQDRGAVLDRVLAALRAPLPGLDSWRRRAHTLGKHVRIGAVAGIATDLRDDGALIVAGTPVLAGEIGL